jgi:hypothetical protein
MRNVSFWKPSKFAFGVLDGDDYIIQSDAVVHEVTISQNNFPALALAEAAGGSDGFR